MPSSRGCARGRRRGSPKRRSRAEGDRAGSRQGRLRDAAGADPRRTGRSSPPPGRSSSDSARTATDAGLQQFRARPARRHRPHRDSGRGPRPRGARPAPPQAEQTRPAPRRCHPATCRYSVRTKAGEQRKAGRLTGIDCPTPGSGSRPRAKAGVLTFVRRPLRGCGVPHLSAGSGRTGAVRSPHPAGRSAHHLPPRRRGLPRWPGESSRSSSRRRAMNRR